MAVVEKSPNYRVGRRVGIGLDALDDEQKQAVGEAIIDRAHFLASTADRRKVRRISKDHPFYSLRMPSGLRIIYSQVGDEIVVLDLMMQATLDRFGPKASQPKNGRTKKARDQPHAKKAK